ncbi:MAG: fimbrial protein [Tannerellaceae bacterium]
MKKYNFSVLLIFISLLLCNSCVDEERLDNRSNIEEGIPTTATLSFAAEKAPEIETKSALSDTQEYKVHNLSVFVFKQKGGSWVKENIQTFAYTDLQNSEGKVILKTTSGTKRIYAIANADGKDIANLNTVSNLNELESLTYTMKDKEVNRSNGKLLMSGFFKPNTTPSTLDGQVGIETDGNLTDAGKISLSHVDSRITFEVATAEGITFTPKEWKVVNVPLKSNVFKQNNDAAFIPFFETDGAGFDAPTTKKDGKVVLPFTFYMMENRQQALTPPAGYSLISKYEEREKQHKSPINGDYIYAPKTSTYVEITGSFFQKYTDENGAQKEKSAEVRYKIHLGYVGNDAADFKSERGNRYTYKVNIAGVDNIELEVTSYNEGQGTTDEKQPGAEGDVVKATTFYYVDAHYETKLITFNKNKIEENASFRVKTPFDENGIGDNAKDIEWVWFVQNSKSRSGSRYLYYTSYSSFPPESAKRITIKELIKKLKAEKNETVDRNSIYDSKGDAVFTVFIDEFYYPNKSWKEFVNVKNREMHILCNTLSSEDKASTLTTSSFLISQRSIKTFYNPESSSLKTAWGVETIREGEQLGSAGKYGNSPTNGRFNMTSYMNFNRFYTWKTYIDLATNAMKSNYAKVDYACMQRNRDLNGDEQISYDEVKWYLPAINQMTGMWIGRDGLPTEAYLFKDDPKGVPADDNDINRQKYHFRHSSNIEMFWAEEGSSTGHYNEGGKYDYRCVRNLGMTETEANIPTSTVEPQDYVEYDNRVFKLSYMNTKSLRPNLSKDELAVTDELNVANRPYKSFKVASKVTSGTITNEDVFNGTGTSPCANYAEGNDDAGTWRMPNQRELSLILAYCDVTDNGGLMSRTTSSLPFKIENKNVYMLDSKSEIITLSGTSGKVRCVKDIQPK